ncbi:hypothetical protein [Actinobaculum sp. 352]|uniref:hypothetical protein n=1 Tax=Actinobaculum sp. 352 TaxID=2490946 RepID=UPI000F7E4DF2|nr:hypothetical protein [Actinobaculum sp. 352]RTE48825.1 hypothetical protein EKN07_08970 [Actinobaculum sp. 352]
MAKEFLSAGKYKPDPDGMVELAVSKDMRDLISRVASRAQAIAGELSTGYYDRKAGGPGVYSDSFTVDDTVVELPPAYRKGNASTQRAASLLTSTHPARRRMESWYEILSDAVQLAAEEILTGGDD